MIVYRIGKSKHKSDLSGEGARLFGGRWNHVSVPCVYTSESRALALLEYSVNVSFENIPRTLSITSIEIAENDILEIPMNQLPGNWMQIPAPISTKDFGSNLLKANASLILKIPSTIIKKEFNFILNPLHISSNTFKVISVEDFVYDSRLKLA